MENFWVAYSVDYEKGDLGGWELTSVVPTPSQSRKG